MQTFKENETFAHSYLLCRFDTCYLIDPSHDLEAMYQALNGRTLAGLLITHAHHDHVNLIGEFEVPIYIHLDDAHLLFEDQYNGYGSHTHPYKRKNLNFQYVSNHTKLPLADQFIEVFHTPGHTKGSVCFYYDQKLFTGDTLFKGSVGRHDLYSGSLPELRKSVLFLGTLPGNVKIYPGHDETSTMRNEHKNNPFYVKWLKQTTK